MAALQGLKLITAKRQTAINPVQFRRNKLSQRVQEQIALAQASLEQRIYVKQRQRSVKDSSGIRNTITTQVRVKQWWWTQDNGKLALSIRYGSKIIALSPKCNAVECSTLTDVVAALTTIKAAVDAGELDAQIAAASEKLREGFTS